MKRINNISLKQYLGCFVAVLWFTGTVCAQQSGKPGVESFESDKVLKQYKATNSSLTITDKHSRFGKTALQWNLNDSASFGTSNFRILSLEESPLKYGDFFPASPTFIISVYNELPQNEKATFSFGKDGKAEVWFDIDLSFKGWRHIWVPFYEMQGNRPKKETSIDYDYFTVSTTAQTGSLYFDDIIFSQFQDDRHAYPDLSVPFIKSDKKPGADHWMPLIQNLELLKNLEAKPISMAMRLDLLKFQKQIDQDLSIHKKYKLYMNTLIEDYKKLRLQDNGTTVSGPPLTFSLDQEYYNKKQQGPKDHNEIKAFGKVLKKLANYHDRANPDQREEIEAMFISGSKYFLDQGWQAGASGGTRHHLGYNIREITEAFYVMRNVLRKEGLLTAVGQSLHWLHNLGTVLGDEKDFHVNIDYLNTQAYYHLMIIFLEESPERQAALLQAYSNYISITLAQEDQEWGFKPDGTSWHHNGHYPAYGMGAFRTVPKVIKTLSGTRYRIKTAGHKNFKRAFLTTRAYSQLYDYGFGNAGRHPLEDNDIKSLKKQYLLMSRSGNPEGTSRIDKDVAAAYLRLWGKKDPLNSSLFTQVEGIQKEVLSGYKTLPYAATAMHRRHNWAAIIKGYSKYVWASEIYVGSNRYGRYPANGTIQLLNRKGEKGSGFQQNGWDWNRYPGATIIYLPFEVLEPDTPLIMFRSKESFAGATELDGNGAFGMLLNESKGDNADGAAVKIGFPGKLKAKKSIFSFGDKLICIGTDISSIDSINPVQTNLFQTALPSNKMPIYTSDKTISKFPYTGELMADSKAEKWLIDPYGNGYHVLSNTEIKIKKAEQDSYHNKYSIRTGKMDPKGKGVKETKGNFASAWLEHGTAPKNSGYQYVIYPGLNEKKIKNFGDRLSKDQSFEINRADGVAHIVSDNEKATTAYVVFEADKNLEQGLLKSVSEPAIVMLRKDSETSIRLSAVQPDLNFAKNPKGKFINYSEPVSLSLTIKGNWKVESNAAVQTVQNNANETTITLECRHGFSVYIKLQKLL